MSPEPVWVDHDRRTDPLDKRAWIAGDCPDCGGQVIGYLLLSSEDGHHSHTRYACTGWVMPPEPEGGRRSRHHEDWGMECGWRGWSIPGWDGD